jgi:hypothetical protein
VYAFIDGNDKRVIGKKLMNSEKRKRSERGPQKLLQAEVEGRSEEVMLKDVMSLKLAACETV